MPDVFPYGVFAISCTFAGTAAALAGAAAALAGGAAECAAGLAICPLCAAGGAECAVGADCGATSLPPPFSFVFCCVPFFIDMLLGDA